MNLSSGRWIIAYLISHLECLIVNRDNINFLLQLFPKKCFLLMSRILLLFTSILSRESDSWITVVLLSNLTSLCLHMSQWRNNPNIYHVIFLRLLSIYHLFLINCVTFVHSGWESSELFYLSTIIANSWNHKDSIDNCPAAQGF